MLEKMILELCKFRDITTSEWKLWTEHVITLNVATGSENFQTRSMPILHALAMTDCTVLLKTQGLRTFSEPNIKLSTILCVCEMIQVHSLRKSAKFPQSLLQTAKLVQ